MKVETPIRDHMMLIVSYLNEMEIFGSEIDGKTKIDMILETLPESFDTFKLNYSMNKLEYTVTELMKELHTAEGLTKKKMTQGEVHAPPPLDLRRDLARPIRTTNLRFKRRRRRQRL